MSTNASVDVLADMLVRSDSLPLLCPFSSSEMWFDDVDPEDLEEGTGKRIKTSNGVEPSDVLVTGTLEGFV